jgi:lipopolysaccharide transport system permease protein
MSNNYRLLIKPKYGLLDINWEEIKEYRELLFFLAMKEVKLRYKQTAIGTAWALLQPLFTMVVFTLIFSKLAHIPSEGVPYTIFSYSGLVIWVYFSNGLSQSSNSLTDNVPLLTKVYIPRIFIPMASCVSGLLDYVISLSLLGVMMLYYHIVPNLNLLLLPVVMFFTFLLTSGLGFLLSSICVRFRDIKYALPFFIQLILFVSPVIYPVNILSSNWQILLYLNPLTGLVSAHRACVLGNMPIDYTSFGISILISIIVFIVGVLYLKSTEKHFADLV